MACVAVREALRVADSQLLVRKGRALACKSDFSKKVQRAWFKLRAHFFVCYQRMHAVSMLVIVVKHRGGIFLE